MDSFEKGSEDDVLLEKSDMSMSDSWTVLDSSHCKEDGDLSDAESVEVLAHEEPQFSDNEQHTPECQSEDCIKGAVDLDAASAADPQSAAEPSVNPDEAAATAAALAAGVAVAAATATAAPRARRKHSECRFRHQLLRLILKLSIVSLSVDIMFIMTLCFFFRDQRMLCNNKFAGFADEPSLLNSIDPLPLQINRMVSGWKKDPQEEHLIARQIFKLMLAFYSRGDITSSLEELRKGILDHNQAISHTRDTYGINHVKYQRQVVSWNLARSVAAILGPHEESHHYSVKLNPEFNASSLHYETFAPEPGLGFEDKYSTTILEVSNSSYLNQNEHMPSYRLHLNLGSPKWNRYFWDVYHGRQLNEVLDSVGEETDVDDDEIEEPERSPLDFESSESQLPESESIGTSAERDIHYALAQDASDQNKYLKDHVDEDYFKGNDAPMPLDILRSEIRREEAKKRELEERGKVDTQYESGTHGNRIYEEKKVQKGKKSKVKKEKKNKAEKKKYKEQDYDKKKQQDTNKDPGKVSSTDYHDLKKMKSKDANNVKEHDQSTKKKSKGKDGKEKLKYDGKFDAQLKERYKKFQEFIEEEKKHERFLRRLGEDFTGDWNTRMARGREKLREDHGKEGWIFERARARRNLREELRSL